jgi:hypothetical protein
MFQIRHSFRLGTPNVTFYLLLIHVPARYCTSDVCNLLRDAEVRYSSIILTNIFTYATLETLSVLSGKYILDVGNLLRDAEKHCLFCQTPRQS